MIIIDSISCHFWLFKEYVIFDGVDFNILGVLLSVVAILIEVEICFDSDKF